MDLDLSDKSKKELKRMWARMEITKSQFEDAVEYGPGETRPPEFTKIQANRTGSVTVEAEAPITAQAAPQQATITLNGEPVRTSRTSPPYGDYFSQTAKLVGSGSNPIRAKVDAGAGDVVALKIDGEERISHSLTQADVEPPAPKDEPDPVPDAGPATPGSTGSGTEVDGDPSTVEDRVEAGLPEEKQDKSSDGPGLDRSASRADRPRDGRVPPENLPENRSGGDSDQGGSGSSGTPTLTPRQKKTLAVLLGALGTAKLQGVI